MNDDQPEVELEEEPEQEIKHPARKQGSSKPADMSPNQLMQKAVEGGADVEVMERLMALQERHEENQAKKAFDRAMAKLRCNLPKIVKDNKVDHAGAKYEYEDLSDVTSALSPVMAEHGLSFRWQTATHTDTNPTTIEVSCIVSHEDGHYEETTLEAPIDQTGSKNPIQGVGSAVTYLQRYTLKAAVGVAAAPDDDAQSVSDQGGGQEQESKDKYYCSLHPNQRIFKNSKGDDEWWSHTIGDTDEWCNDGDPITKPEREAGGGDSDPTPSGDQKEQSTQTQQKSSNTSTDQDNKSGPGKVLGDASDDNGIGSIHKAIEAFVGEISLEWDSEKHDDQELERTWFKRYLDHVADKYDIESMKDVPVELAKKVLDAENHKFEVNYRRWQSEQIDKEIVENRLSELTGEGESDEPW